jgi:2-oxoglutarate ferredoxin oxidoreductase subunit alpha
MEKRMGKLDLIAKAIPKDMQYALHGPEDAELTVVSWGSPKGTILDAMKTLAEQGKRINFLQCRLMRPFPAADVEAILRKAKRLCLVEENYSGQLGSLVREQTGVLIEERILKYDGRPFSEDELVKAFSALLDGTAKHEQAVMTHVR